jgi:ABC-type nitrate/sulfonate/bicarbonate transport system substrate-binding protein
MRKMLRGLLAGALLLSSMTAAAPAQPELTALRIAIPSKTASDWQTFVAIRRGLFERNGIKPRLIVTGSSGADARLLAGVKVEVAQVTTVTLVAAAHTGAPIVGVINSSAGVPFFVVARKGFSSLTQLKGRTITIGGRTDITRILMDEMLTRAGLHPGDVTYTYLGATSVRYAALIDGKTDATLLFPPYVSRAAGKGYPVLADVSKYFPRFPFNTWSVRRQWAVHHADLVTAFARARNEAVRWLYDPANKQEAIAILSEETNASPQDAAEAYDIFISKVRYFVPDGVFKAGTFNAVVDAMVKAGIINSAETPLPYYDNRFVLAANAKP